MDISIHSQRKQLSKALTSANPASARAGTKTQISREHPAISGRTSPIPASRGQQLRKANIEKLRKNSNKSASPYFLYFSYFILFIFFCTYTIVF